MKKKIKLLIKVILFLILAICIWIKKYYIADIPNYYELLTSFHDFSIFISGIILTLFGVSSFLPNNRFIKKLRNLNVDLLLTSKLFNLSLVSIVISTIPLFLLFFDKEDKSEFGRLIIIIVLVAVFGFFVELYDLARQLKTILNEVVDNEKEQRKL